MYWTNYFLFAIGAWVTAGACHVADAIDRNTAACTPTGDPAADTEGE